jgi:hypothetical protein
MGFLQDYAIVTSGNECPPVFHKWAGLSALSSICSRRVWTDMSLFPVYANMYILFVGMPGSKKSTGMKFAQSLIEALGDIPISPDSITKEALTELMGMVEDSPFRRRVEINNELIQYTHVSLFCNEFVTLLEAGNNSTNMITFLTEVWDKQTFKIATKHQGVDDIPHPYVTLLGCLTTETMSNLASQKIITSGFSRRCMFIYSNDYADPIPFPTITQEQKDAKKRMFERAREIQKLKGIYTLDDGAKMWWDKWYRTNHARMTSESDAIFQAYLQTKAQYVIKIAMLVHMSEHNDLILTADDLNVALAYLDSIEPNMMRVFEGTGRNDKAPVASEIKRVIETSEIPIPVKQILKQFYKKADNEEIKKILDHLHQTGEIWRGSQTLAGGIVINLVGSLEVGAKIAQAAGPQAQQPPGAKA